MSAKTFLTPIGLFLVLACPFLIQSPYYLHLAITIAIFSILLLGLDVVFGYTGEVSIGHAALLGIGAYTAGCLAMHLEIGLWPALLFGPVIAALFGLILALPALRVTGPYLAMVTLAFGTIVQILINEMDFLTNGPLGIKLNKPLFFDWRDFSNVLPFLDMPLTRMREAQFFYLAAAFLILAIMVINRILASRYGRAFEALRDSPIASDCMGVSVYKHKVFAFVTSAAFAGVAGVLFAYSEQYIAPNTFGFDLSVQFLLAVTLGGRKSRLGPILGALVIVYLPNLLADIDLFRKLAGLIAVIAVIAGVNALIRRPENRLRTAVPMVLCLAFFVFSLELQKITDYRAALYGLMILFVVYYLPEGVIGFLKQMVARVRPDWVRKHEVIEADGKAGDAFAAPAASGGAGPLLDASKILLRLDRKSVV